MFSYKFRTLLIATTLLVIYPIFCEAEGETPKEFDVAEFKRKIHEEILGAMGDGDIAEAAQIMKYYVKPEAEISNLVDKTMEQNPDMTLAAAQTKVWVEEVLPYAILDMQELMVTHPTIDPAAVALGEAAKNPTPYTVPQGVMDQINEVREVSRKSAYEIMRDPSISNIILEAAFLSLLEQQRETLANQMFMSALTSLEFTPSGWAYGPSWVEAMPKRKVSPILPPITAFRYASEALSDELWDRIRKYKEERGEESEERNKKIDKEFEKYFSTPSDNQ